MALLDLFYFMGDPMNWFIAAAVFAVLVLFGGGRLALSFCLSSFFVGGIMVIIGITPPLTQDQAMWVFVGWFFLGSIMWSAFF